MIKILHIIPGLNRGGAETLLLNFISNSSKEFEHKVWYFETDKEQELVTELESKGIEVINLTTFKNWFNFSDLPKVVSKIKKINPDIVHLHVTYFWKMSYALASKLAEKKVVITLHYLPHTLGKIKTPILKIFERLTNSLADKFVAISTEVKNERKKLFKTPEDKIKVIFNGIDFSKLKITRNSDEVLKELKVTKNDFIIGTVGNVRWEKGTEFLVEVANLLSKEIENFKIIVVGAFGGNPYSNEISEKIQNYSLKEKFIFVGKKLDVANYINCFDTFVLPSKSEGFGLALVEAMYLGKPSVAFKIGGVSDIILSERFGLLAKPENSLELAEQLLKLIKMDSQQRMEIGKHGKEFVNENFGIKTLVTKYESLYSELIG
ncbi:MAG: glycosyltransferase [Calditrichaeota bacterium]|nr:MAG: glycosyltransferase [Calditrichota bacterium]